MGRLRFWLLGLVGFAATWLGSLLTPGAGLNRVLAGTLCLLLGADSGLCVALARSVSSRAVAADVQVAQREFFEEEPPAANPNAPAYPQDAGPDVFREGEFGTPAERAAEEVIIENSIQNAGTDAASDFIDPATDVLNRQPTEQCEEQRYYTIYINGIQTDHITALETTPLISAVLAEAGVPEPYNKIVDAAYNYSSKGGHLSWNEKILSPIGDLAESAGQLFFDRAFTGDGQQLVGEIIQTISDDYNEHKNLSKENCECELLKPKYLIIAHSQGNFFAEEVAANLPQELADRTAFFSISSFTDYGAAQGRVRLDYLLREDDIAAVVHGIPGTERIGQPSAAFPTSVELAEKWDNREDRARAITASLPFILRVHGIVPMNLASALIDHLKAKGVPLEQSIFSHSIDNYLGLQPIPSGMEIPPQDFPAFQAIVQNSRQTAITKIQNLLASIQEETYEKDRGDSGKEDCSEKEDSGEERSGDLTKGTSYGDPHLITFDGFRYSFQTVGEFILAKSIGGDFEVQTRQVPVPGRQLSLNAAAAMKVGQDRVAIYSQYLPDGNTSTPLRVNGRPTTINGGSLNLPDGGTIYTTGSGYLIEWPSGEQVGIKRISIGGGNYLNVTPYVYSNPGGQFTGLLGNLDGDPGNDFRTRSGNVIPSRSTYGEIKNIVTQIVPIPGVIPLDRIETAVFDQIYKDFGNSWRVEQSESLFDYASGQTTASFTDTSFPNKYRTLGMLSPQQIEQAERTCIEAGVEPDLLDGCIFDVGFTGEQDFAQAAANALNIIEDFSDLIPGGISVPRPSIPGLPSF